MNGVPIRDGKDALLVNWLDIEIADSAGNITYRNNFVTDLPVNKANAAALAACGRARWKIENENFNILKNKGTTSNTTSATARSTWRTYSPP